MQFFDNSNVIPQKKNNNVKKVSNSFNLQCMIKSYIANPETATILTKRRRKFARFLRCNFPRSPALTISQKQKKRNSFNWECMIKFPKSENCDGFDPKKKEKNSRNSKRFPQSVHVLNSLEGLVSLKLRQPGCCWLEDTGRDIRIISV